MSQPGQGWRLGRDTPAEKANERERGRRSPVRTLVGGRFEAASCGRGLHAKDNPAAPGPGRRRRRGLANHATVPSRRHMCEAAMRLRSWRCLVTDRCTLGQWTCQCRSPLVPVDGVALAGDQAWPSPQDDGEWRVEFAGFRGRGWPMTTIWVAGRGVVDPHPVPARTRLRLPARERITPAFARRSISFASEARDARSS